MAYIYYTNIKILCIISGKNQRIGDFYAIIINGDNRSNFEGNIRWIIRKNMKEKNFIKLFGKWWIDNKKLSNEVVKKLAEYYNVSISDIFD